MSKNPETHLLDQLHKVRTVLTNRDEKTNERTVQIVESYIDIREILYLFSIVDDDEESLIEGGVSLDSICGISYINGINLFVNYNIDDFADFVNKIKRNENPYDDNEGLLNNGEELLS